MPGAPKPVGGFGNIPAVWQQLGQTINTLQGQTKALNQGARQTNLVDGNGNTQVINGNLAQTVTIGASFGQAGVQVGTALTNTAGIAVQQDLATTTISTTHGSPTATVASATGLDVGMVIGAATPSNTVASGSNGGTIANVASWSNPSAGVLDVASTDGFAPSGALIVSTSTGTAEVTYTAITGTSFTGCAYVSGSGTVATGGTVTSPQSPITPGTTISAISGTTVTLSQNAAATGSSLYCAACNWVDLAAGPATASFQVEVVSTVHAGTPKTVDLAGSTSGVPCTTQYSSPSLGDLALIGENIGAIPGSPSWGTTNKVAIGKFATYTGTGNWIVAVTTAGVVSIYPTTFGIDWISPGSDGNVWGNAVNIAGTVDEFYAVTPTGAVTTEYTFASNLGAGGTCLGPDGNVWFFETSNLTSLCNTIGKVTPAGVVTFYAVLPNVGSNPGFVNDICVGSDDNIWVYQQFGGAAQLTKVSTSGSVLATYSCPITSYSSTASGQLTTGPDGEIWFWQVVPGLTFTLSKCTTSGTFTTLTTSFPTGGPSIVSGPDGNLWWAQDSGGHYGKVTTGGTVTSYSGPSGCSFSGIVVGPDNNLWAADAGTNSMAKITTGGAITEYALSGLTPDSNVVAGPDGRLWVAAY